MPSRIAQPIGIPNEIANGILSRMDDSNRLLSDESCPNNNNAKELEIDTTSNTQAAARSGPSGVTSDNNANNNDQTAIAIDRGEPYKDE